MNYASVEMFPNNFVITVFDENATLLDSRFILEITSLASL